MRHCSLTRLIAFFAVAMLCLAGCSSPLARQTHAPARGESVMPLVQRGGFWLVPVRLNGREVGFFLVDTGANLTVIEETLAREMRLPTRGEAMATGIGGIRRLTLHTFDNLTAGGLDFGYGVAAAMDLTFLNDGGGIRVVGILGYNTLATRPFTLDYRAGRITLHSREAFLPPVGAKASQLFLIENIPAVPVVFEGYGKAWLQIDTGANGYVMLPSAAAPKWPTLLPAHGGLLGGSRGLGDPIKVIRTQVPGMRLMGVTLRDTPCDVEWTNRVGEYQGRLVGRVGNGVLRGYRLTFDPQASKVYAVWNPGP